MSGFKEARIYHMGSVLTPKQWSLLESTMDRIGVEFSLQYSEQGLEPDPPLEAELSMAGLTKSSFRETADELGFSRESANRAWNALAAFHACVTENTVSAGWLPHAFKDVTLVYEVDPRDERQLGPVYNYQRKLDGLRPESLSRFMRVVESQINLVRRPVRADLPKGFGPQTVAYLQGLVGTFCAATIN